MLEKMLERFNSHYEGLYSETETAPGAASKFDEALQSGEFLAKVLEFNKCRGDQITSDREAAAYWLAWQDMQEGGEA